MTISLPALFEAPPRASGWAMAACFGLSLLFLVGFVAPSPHADDWGSLATISSTMGVQEGRLCLGESTRGDLGCPAYAPYVSRTTGYVGIGTMAPSATLHIYNAGTAYGLAVTSIANSRTIILNSNAADIIISSTLEAGIPLHLNRTVPNPVILASGGGNVGVGTTATVNPSTSLHVSGTLRIAAGNENCDTNRRGAIKYEANDFHLCRNGITWESLNSVAGNTTPDRLISGTTQAIAYQNTSLSLVTAGTERMVIGTNGNIGIGSQPIDYATLTVSGSTTFTSAKLELMQSGTPAYMAFVRSNGTTANKLPVEKGNTIADLIAWPFNGTTTTYTAGITYLVDEDIVAGVVPTAIRFTTRNVSNTYGERVRIASNGNVGIGTSTPAEKLDVAGNIKVPYNFALVSNPLTANPYLMRNFYDGSFDKLEIAAAGNSRSRIGFLTTSANGTSPTERLTITHGGSVGIGILTPTTALDVSGTVSATTLQLADNPSNPCNAANKGMAKVIDGRIYVCRYP